MDDESDSDDDLDSEGSDRGAGEEVYDPSGKQDFSPDDAEQDPDFRAFLDSMEEEDAR